MVGKIYRNIIVIQLSVSILSLIGANINLIIVGKFLSAEALAACGLVMPVVQFASVLDGVITTGIKTVCARSIGEGNRRKANDQISSAAIFSIITFSCLCILGYVFVDNIASALAGANSGDLFFYVKDYMLGYLLVIPSLGLLSLFVFILQMNNKMGYCTSAAIVFILLNGILDLLSLFVLDWGIFGIGLSTSIAYFVMIGILLTGYFRTGTTLKISLKRFRISCFLEIVKNGITNAIASGTNMIIKVIVNLVVLESAGTDALAAVTVIVSFAAILMSVSKAIAYCTDMTSSMFFGERNIEELKNTIRTFFKYSLVINVLLAIVVSLTSEWCCLLFTNAHEVAYPMAVYALRLFTPSLVFYSIAMCFVYYFLAIKKPAHSYVLAALINISLGVYSALLIPLWMVNGAAVAYVFAYFTVFILIVLFFCVRNKSNPFKVDTYLMLPKNFAVNQNFVFEKGLNTIEDVYKMSYEALDFCKRHNADERTSLAVSLVIEELGKNTFEHRSVKNRKCAFDIRVVYDEDKNTWIVRTRDDCKEFNPVKYLELHKDEISKEKFGLTIVLKMAKNAQYYNTMGLNNLVVEF